jgi:hypothetical protein
MSWLYSQALVEEYLGENFSDGEQSAPLSGNHIPQAYCSPDKMTELSRLSRYGMTYKPLTENLGEELLTLYLEVFHAKTLVPQEKAQELTGKEAECGEKWRASFTKFDPDLSLWRTHQCSLLGDLDEFSETWPQWGLMRDGECWEQRTLEQTIRGTGYGFSPNGVDSFHTPNTTGLDGGSNSRRALKKKVELCPTPTSSTGGPNHNSPTTLAGKRYTMNLAGYAQKFPTPLATDWKPRGPNSKQQGLAERVKWGTPKAQDSRHALWDRGKSNLGEQVSGLHNGGKLNPTWVEWLMGWPLEWTDLKPLEMDKSLCVQQPHGEF